MTSHHQSNFAENRDEYHRAAAGECPECLAPLGTNLHQPGCTRGPQAKRDSATRKGQPIATGVLAYFPKALALISEVSRRGNDKHNPGQPLHWAKEKSTDEADCAVRHIVDALAEGPLALDTEGAPNLASAAWRILAWLERVLEGDERWRTTAKAGPTGPVGSPGPYSDMGEPPRVRRHG